MKVKDPLVQVRCFLLDMDGTFYLGDRLLNGAMRFIDALRQQGREYLFLTNNSSRDSRVYADKLSRMGLPTLPDRIMTAGEATAMHIQTQKADARVYVVGTPELENEFSIRNLVYTDENPDFAVLGFDTTLTYAKLWKLCDLVRAGLPYIATHPDFNCPTEAGFMPDIGAMIAFVKASTGREPDLVVGKPNRLLAEKAAERVGIPLSSMCMIGDRLYTDIALGAAAGIPSILVLSGETGIEDVEKSDHRPDYIFRDLGAVADYLVDMDSAG